MDLLGELSLYANQCNVKTNQVATNWIQTPQRWDCEVVCTCIKDAYLHMRLLERCEPAGLFVSLISSLLLLLLLHCFWRSTVTTLTFTYRYNPPPNPYSVLHVSTYENKLLPPFPYTYLHFTNTNFFNPVLHFCYFYSHFAKYFFKIISFKFNFFSADDIFIYRFYRVLPHFQTCSLFFNHFFAEKFLISGKIDRPITECE